ncbi:MAG: flavin reductase family protein [Chloroflexi bacterium]|nr:flavin reductase family protein [Chloroflexota bacterium]
MIDKRLSAGLRLIANGVFVISTEYRGQVRGFTATWVSQVSYEHPLVMVSASKTHDTYPLIVSSDKFCVNVLGASQAEIARHFGRRKGPTETDAHYFREERGQVTPVLKDAIAFIQCKVISTHDAKDHTIFVGEVLNSQVLREEAPLVYWRAVRYARPEPLEQIR